RIVGSRCEFRVSGVWPTLGTFPKRMTSRPRQATDKRPKPTAELSINWPSGPRRAGRREHLRGPAGSAPFAVATPRPCRYRGANGKQARIAGRGLAALDTLSERHSPTRMVTTRWSSIVEEGPISRHVRVPYGP